jgi:hypothetical protein
MNRGGVGEERGSKETDGCPLTVPLYIGSCMWVIDRTILVCGQLS